MGIENHSTNESEIELDNLSKPSFDNTGDTDDFDEEEPNFFDDDEDGDFSFIDCTIGFCCGIFFGLCGIWCMLCSYKRSSYAIGLAIAVVIGFIMFFVYQLFFYPY